MSLSEKLEDARATMKSVLEDLTEQHLTVKGEEMVALLQQTLDRTKENRGYDVSRKVQ